MMQKLRIPLLIVIALSFTLGVSWGIKLHREREEALGRMRPANEVKILAYRGLITPQLLKTFHSRTGIRARVKEVATPEELWNELESSKTGEGPDVVSLFSYQVPLANQLGRIQPVDLTRLPNMSAISPDFLDLPGDRSLGRVVPVLWGLSGMLLDRERAGQFVSWSEILRDPTLKNKVGLLPSTADFLRLVAPVESREKTSINHLDRAISPWLGHAKLSNHFLSPKSLLTETDKPLALMISHGESAFKPLNGPEWKFVIPREKATLWVLSFALARDAKAETESHQFLDFLLERKTAISLIHDYRQASTNRRIEQEKIDPRLKPSYIREFPLSQMVLLQDFSRAREMRDALSGAAEASPTPSGAGPGRRRK
jgi:spermidine/putrescine transport system substrate-binding protein